MAYEGLMKTDNDLIHIGKPIPFNVEEFLHQLEVLADASYANDTEICRMVEKIVPTYHPADSDLKQHRDVYEALLKETAAAKSC